MKVKIVSSELDSHWYSHRIGEEFEVEDNAINEYTVASNGALKRYIEKVDCEITEETMTERGRLIKTTEEFLEFVKDKKTVSVFPHNYFKDEIKFDDEQPKIMTAEEYAVLEYSMKDDNREFWSKKDIIKAFKAGAAEDRKCFQPLVDELESNTLKEDDPELFDIYIRLLNLVIE